MKHGQSFKTMAITINGSTGVQLEDNDKQQFGTGDDLQIYHNGSSSFISDEGTGSLKITTNGTGVDIQKGSSETIARFIADGACELYNDNSKKFHTYSDGCSVFGHLNLEDNDKLRLGDSSDLQIGHDGSDNFINANNDHSIRIQRSGSNIWEFGDSIFKGNDGKKVILGSSSDLQLHHNGSHSYIEHDGTGELFVGTTDNAGSSIKLMTDGGTRVEINANGRFMHTSGDDTMSTAAVAGAVRMQLVHTGGGDVTWSNPSSGSATYSTSSDYRLKQDVVDLPNAWSTVKALKPYEYKWKHNISKTSQGFFAHEVIATVPNSQAGQGTKDAVDSDSNPIYQQIDYSKLVPVLTKALQEAITEIETLKTKVAALEAA